MFNIHKQTESKEDKEILNRILIGQEMRARNHNFKMFCGCCKREVYILFACKCFYCGIWFCVECAEIHFAKDKNKILS